MAKGVSNRWIILGTLAFFALVFIAWLLLRSPTESPTLSGSDAQANPKIRSSPLVQRLAAHPVPFIDDAAVTTRRVVPSAAADT